MWGAVGGVFCSRRRRGGRSLVGMENLEGSLGDPGVAVVRFFVSFWMYWWVVRLGSWPLDVDIGFDWLERVDPTSQYEGNSNIS